MLDAARGWVEKHVCAAVGCSSWFAERWTWPLTVCPRMLRVLYGPDDE